MNLIVDEIWEFIEYTTCWVQNVRVWMIEFFTIDSQVNL